VFRIYAVMKPKLTYIEGEDDTMDYGD